VACTNYWQGTTFYSPEQRDERGSFPKQQNGSDSLAVIM